MKLKLVLVTSILALISQETSAQCPSSGFCLASEHPGGDASKFPCYRSDSSNANWFYMCWGTHSWHLECPPKAGGGLLKWDPSELVCNW